MNDGPVRVLFLCTGNSARSLMAEAILNVRGSVRVRGCSAGSHPKGRVHPMAIELLERRKLPTGGLHSKGWDEFARPGAEPLDYIVTVCDNAASEACPVWPGHPATEHWSIPDPAAVAGSDDEKRRAFETAFVMLEDRIEKLVQRLEAGRGAANA